VSPAALDQVVPPAGDFPAIALNRVSSASRRKERMPIAPPGRVMTPQMPKPRSYSAAAVALVSTMCPITDSAITPAGRNSVDHRQHCGPLRRRELADDGMTRQVEGGGVQPCSSNADGGGGYIAAGHCGVSRASKSNVQTAQTEMPRGGADKVRAQQAGRELQGEAAPFHGVAVAGSALLLARQDVAASPLSSATKAEPRRDALRVSYRRQGTRESRLSPQRRNGGFSIMRKWERPLREERGRPTNRSQASPCRAESSMQVASAAHSGPPSRDATSGAV
jgi:hypothetical protein